MKRMDECTEPTATSGVEDSSASSQQGSSTSEAPSATRIVAKIIDPSVRDDGRGDPQFTSQVPQTRAPGSHSRASAGHPVRDRLLAKARAATSTFPAAGAASTDAEAPPARSAVPSKAPAGEGEAEPRFESLPDLADDLDLIGAPERPRPERMPIVKAPMRAPTALLVGTGAGLLAIAALFTALTQLLPRQPLRLPGRIAIETPLPAPSEAEPAPPAPTGSVEHAPRVRVPGPWRIADAAHDPRYRHLSASVGERSFLSAATATGINRKDVYRILTAVGGLKNLDRCRPRDAFSALLDTETGRLTAFEYIVSDEEIYQGRENDEGKLVAKKLDLDVQRHRASGVIILNGSFDEAARRAGFEPGLGDVVNRALSGYVSTTEFKAGDVLGVVAQEVTVLGSFARYAGVEALEYRPVSGEPLRIYYNDTDKGRGYVDSRGRAFGRSRFSRPVPGAGVTSRFNPRRMHPILKRIKPHNGTDFGAPIGTPVLATSAGRIAFVGRAGPNGNMITLAHGGGITTGYSHLSRFVKGLRVGMNVDQRQLIGYVGSTGRSTGPHLHFSAKRNGRFIDPETLNLDGLARLSQDQRLPAEVRRRYDRMLDELRLPAARAPQATEVARSEPSSGLQVEIASARVAPAAIMNAPPTEPTARAPRAPEPSPTSVPEPAREVVESPPPISFEPEPATVLPLPPQSILATPVEGQDLEPLD